MKPRDENRFQHRLEYFREVRPYAGVQESKSVCPGPANEYESLREYCIRGGIEITHCAHVGDGFNDVVAFKGLGLSVAFNPHEENVSRTATYQVRSDSLLDVYRVLEPNLPVRS